MKDVNFNYAATSAVKPDVSIKAMMDYLNKNNANNPARGGDSSLTEGRIEVDTRIALCELFKAKKPEQIIFTPNITMSLNMIIHGLVKKGDHVISTSIEHNAVARPLELLRANGMIEVTYLPCRKDGNLDIAIVEEAFQSNTSLMVMTHASNVFGTILPYEACAEIAKTHNAAFVLDSAQTAGLIDYDFEKSLIDVLCFTGHKSLMGPCGIGGFAIKAGFVDHVKPFITGGTGSASHLLSQPGFLPDKFESGTPNVLGIIGLGAAVEFINQISPAAILAHEKMLTERFINGIRDLPINIFIADDPNTRMPVVSITIDGMDSGVLSARLYDEFGISTRSGLHCAPLAHKTIGTYPEGTVRFSFGYFTTVEEIDYGIVCLRKICL